MVMCTYVIQNGPVMRAIVHPDSAARLLQLIQSSKQVVVPPPPSKTETDLLQEVVNELRFNPSFGRMALERIEHYKENPL
jgi:hypothetical protein